MGSTWKTSGYGRKVGVYYHHRETRTIFIKPLHKDARQILHKKMSADTYSSAHLRGLLLIKSSAVWLETENNNILK
jgi:hypothetical protein